MLSHIDLSSLYQLLFSMVQHHKYSLSELENMVPYEFDIYVSMLANHLKELEKANK